MFENPLYIQILFEGLAAGSWYAHKGGASELICLPLEPQWSNYADGWNSKAYIYGAEYELAYDPFSHDNAEVIHEHDMPCVVCRVPTRGVEVHSVASFSRFGNICDRNCI